MSEAPIFASTNLQYDNRLLIELQVQYIKTPSSYLGRTCCVQKLFWMFSPGLSLEFSCKYWTCNPLNNQLSYCRLVDAKIRASDKDLPVMKSIRTRWSKLYPFHHIQGVFDTIWSRYSKMIVEEHFKDCHTYIISFES